MRWRRALAIAVVLLVAGGGWHTLRKRLRPAMSPPDAATLAQAERVRILRDQYGVPHVFGQSDGDADGSEDVCAEDTSGIHDASIRSYCGFPPLMFTTLPVLTARITSSGAIP